ncbi:MAG: restriction endonuclease subunit S [bacterium]
MTKKNLNNDLFDNNFKEVLISDIFIFPSIKGLTARFIQENLGNIPVYGGRKEETPIGFIEDNLKGVKYFENCLGWNREGSVGYVFWHKQKFTTNDHHRPLIVKPEISPIIDLNYMKHEIQEVLLKQGFRWSKTASKEKVEKISIKVPILPNGNYDLAAQKEISKKHQVIEQVKQELEEKLNDLLKVNIDF